MKDADLVKDHEVKKFAKLEERLDPDFDSVNEEREKTKSHLLKIHTKEKPSGSLKRNKKRRFKPKIKPVINSHKHPIVRTAHKKRTKAITKNGNTTVEPVQQTKHMKVQNKQEEISSVPILTEKTLQEGTERRKEVLFEIFDELLDEVYRKPNVSKDKVSTLKKTEKEPK